MTASHRLRGGFWIHRKNGRPIADGLDPRVALTNETGGESSRRRRSSRLPSRPLLSSNTPPRRLHVSPTLCSVEASRLLASIPPARTGRRRLDSPTLLAPSGSTLVAIATRWWQKVELTGSDYSSFASRIRIMAFAFVLRSTPRLASRAAPQIARTSARRGYASGPAQAKSNNGLLFGALGAAVVGGGLYFYARPDPNDQRTIKDAASPKEVDYQAVYNAIADSLEDEKYDGEECSPSCETGRAGPQC